MLRAFFGSFIKSPRAVPVGMTLAQGGSMDITCSLPGRTAEAVWRHPPLAPSKLQHLHCPG